MDLADSSKVDLGLSEVYKCFGDKVLCDAPQYGEV